MKYKKSVIVREVEQKLKQYAKGHKDDYVTLPYDIPIQEGVFDGLEYRIIPKGFIQYKIRIDPDIINKIH